MKNFFIAFYLLSIIIFISSCSINRNIVKKETIEYPSMTQNNYNHYIYKNMKKYLYAKIDHAEFYDKKNSIECTGLLVEIYNSKQEKTNIIHADKGNINKTEKKLYFTGNVIFELIENKAKLISEELVLDYQNNRLSSSKDVLFTKDDGSYIKATSMDSDIKLDSTKFTNMEIKYFYKDEDKDVDKKTENKKK